MSAADALNPPSLSRDYFLPEKEEKSIMVATAEAVESETPSDSDAPVERSEVDADALDGSVKVDETLDIKLESAPADYRFPATNQSKHCFTRYIEYHRCIADRGEDAKECNKFAKYYRSLCPGEWVEKWNEQRENGTFAGPL